jgi:hypothetical protein
MRCPNGPIVYGYVLPLYDRLSPIESAHARDAPHIKPLTAPSSSSPCFERLHKFLLETEGVSEVSDDMRELVEQEWPELVHKLPKVA